MLRYILVVVLLYLYSYVSAQVPFVVFNSSPGVILKSSKYGLITNPVPGTEVFERDTFNLKDERYIIRIKDTHSGEIYKFSGKGLITPRQIVSKQRYDLFDKFISFLESLAIETGFNTSPVRTSQGVTYRGNRGEQRNHSDLSQRISSQIMKTISDSIYYSSVNVTKVYSQDNETFCWSFMFLEIL